MGKFAIAELAAFDRGYTVGRCCALCGASMAVAAAC
jgi:hypothetical protein